MRVKTTLHIADALLARARQYAKKTGRPLRAVIEEGLRQVLDDAEAKQDYRLPDRSVGNAAAPDPLEALFWSDLCGKIYGDH
jgi:hypothetical protein